MRLEQLVFLVLDEHDTDELKDADEHDDDEEAQVQTGLLGRPRVGPSKARLIPIIGSPAARRRS